MDNIAAIVAAVNNARDSGYALQIRGQGSKRQWLPDVSGDLLTIAEHSGIQAYDPAELVVTVNAGTPISDVVAELAHAGQMLAFEPPLFFGGGTIGGMLSAGLSGPARPWGGSVRDAVLGVEIVNGLGEHLTFGGQVMKNVAGYDVSRLMTGAFGTLGVVLKASLRVQPIPEHEVTVACPSDAATAVRQCRCLARHFLPITGTWWTADTLYIRLSGSSAGIDAALTTISTVMGKTGSEIEAGQLWNSVRDHTADFFKQSAPGMDHGDARLWRIVVPPATENPGIGAADIAIEWGGGLRWMWHDDGHAVQRYAQANGGWAWALGEAIVLPAAQRRVMAAIKQAFDPAGVFASPLDLRVPE